MAESETGLTLTAQLKLMLSSEAYHYCADCHSHCRQTSLAVAAAKEAVKAHVSDAQQLVELRRVGQWALDAQVEYNGPCDHEARYADDCLQCQLRAALNPSPAGKETPRK